MPTRKEDNPRGGGIILDVFIWILAKPGFTIVRSLFWMGDFMEGFIGRMTGKWYEKSFMNFVDRFWERRKRRAVVEEEDGLKDDQDVI